MTGLHWSEKFWSKSDITLEKNLVNENRGESWQENVWKGKLLLERGSKPGGGREQVEEQSEVPGLDSLSKVVDSFLTG